MRRAALRGNRARLAAAVMIGAGLLVVAPLASADPPGVSITAHPQSPTNSASAQFSFGSPDVGATFACQVDGGGFSSCASGVTFSVGEGSHSFDVQATNAASETSIDSYTWTVDLTAPSLVLPGQSVEVPDYTGPVSVTYSGIGASDTSGIASFSCNPASGSTFALGTSAPVTCNATDTVGNTASGSFTVTVTDTTAPAAPTVTGGPTGPTNDATPTFTFSPVNGATSYRCAIDDPTPGATCSASGFTAGSLGDGGHVFYVTAADGSGNTGPAGSRSFSVDRTAPSLVLPGQSVEVPDYTGPVSVTYSGIGASDTSGIASFSCNPASGSTFALGTSAPVTCNATDTVGNTASGSFTVTVTDTTAPAAPTVTGGPTGPTNDATPTFTFSPVNGATSYRCAIDDPTPTTSCTPAGFTSPTTPDGGHTFYVAARDTAGNLSAVASRSFTVDRTPSATSITSSVPALTTLRAISIAFTATEAGSTFTCSFDGGASASCSSPLGLTGLADGTHTLAVRATDPVGNTNPTPAVATWTVDATPPRAKPRGVRHQGRPGRGPGGTSVDFAVSDRTTAWRCFVSDRLRACERRGLPARHDTRHLHGLGRCGQRWHGHVHRVGARHDRTLDQRAERQLRRADAAGIATSAPSVAAYLNGITAFDLVSTPTLTTNAPSLFPIGVSTLVVTARDAAGNVASKNVTVTVLQPGSPAPAPDLTPPAAVASAKATAGDRRIVLTWKHPAGDLARVEVRRSIVGEAGTDGLIYSGLGETATSAGLRNGVTYRFVLVAFDAAGNSSASVIVNATPLALLLARPLPGGRVSRPPLLRWGYVPSSYFNVQLYRGGVKILSAWPVKTRLQLTSSWAYKGRKLQLKPGVYTWYVWPGIGARADVRYGDLLGTSSFVVVAAPKKSS